MSVEISVVLPVHNQADHIAGVVEGYLAAMGRVAQHWEIVLVPNGCSDQTPQICRDLADHHGAIRVVELPSGGWGRAVKAGIAAAEGELVCYTNAARTQPELLTLILLYAKAYPDVVVKANRRIRDNWRRRLGSVIYNLECRALFDLATWDINGTPKVFSRKHEQLLRLQREDDLIDAEFVATCSQRGYPLVEVPVLATTRHGGRSTTNLTSAVRMYVGALRLRRSL
jgi:glycosyltransferase involved in cell wall biosynthesis